ncbi:hypothetical protein [Streptomyces sp. NBC_01198]|uniref:hypothetical protein n=1 Tax=Streptomyces sp. NBC_01198 TaxID=2903769 RepID=UPI002E105B99|nr:hypothetical protein OG702_31880 [Streptomyces sp. NBC_01198]
MTRSIRMVRVRRELVVEYESPVEHYHGMSDEEIKTFEREGVLLEHFVEWARETSVGVDIDPEVSE